MKKVAFEVIDFLSPKERSLRVQVFFDLYIEGKEQELMRGVKYAKI